MGLSSTNVALNQAVTVRFDVSSLSNGTLVLNICASDVEDRIFFPHSETALFMTREQMQELAQKLNIFLVPELKEVEEDCCDSCNVSKDECECVDCDSCGEKTKQEDLYEGRCPGCEDEQMVRSIK